MTWLQLSACSCKRCREARLMDVRFGLVIGAVCGAVIVAGVFAIAALAVERCDGCGNVITRPDSAWRDVYLTHPNARCLRSAEAKHNG